MRPTTLLLLGLGLLRLSAVAQDGRQVDSLRTVLVHASRDSTRVDALIALAGECLQRAPDSAFALCERARELADRTGRPGDPGEVEGWLGYLEEQRGRIPEAITHYEQSLAVAQRLKDLKGISVLLNNLGAIYKDQGRIDEALAAHRKSLAIREQRHDTLGIATSLNNIGLILYDQGRIPEALDHYMRALHLYGSIHDADGTATALHNIAGIHRDQGDYLQALTYLGRAMELSRKLDDSYSMASTEDNIGGVLEQQGRADQALSHYEEALRLHAKADDARGMGYSLRNIAGIELKRGHADTALARATESLHRFDAAEDKRGRASALWMMGSALESLGRTREAETRALQALTLARELGYPQLVRDAAQLLGRLYTKQQRWREALDMQGTFVAMRDSVRNEETRKSTIRQQYQYAYEKKEAALEAEQREKDLLAREALQKEKNRRNILLFIGCGVLLLAVGLWSRLQYVRRSRSAIQKEKDISEGLLLNILPAAVADELRTKGHAEARLYENATVLFTDFKGFTAIAEKLPAAELVHEIDACFKAFDGIIGRYGVEKIKTIGDAYMAVGGLPEPSRSTPLDVVHAALEMQAFMHARWADHTEKGLPAFGMRVGIHTGPVVAGIVGVKKFQFDIWGDTVNTASRMESSGEVGRVNISGTTHALVKDAAGLHFEPRGLVNAKGKGELEMFYVGVHEAVPASAAGN